MPIEVVPAVSVEFAAEKRAAMVASPTLQLVAVVMVVVTRQSTGPMIAFAGQQVRDRVGGRAGSRERDQLVPVVFAALFGMSPETSAPQLRSPCRNVDDVGLPLPSCAAVGEPLKFANDGCAPEITPAALMEVAKLFAARVLPAIAACFALNAPVGRAERAALGRARRGKAEGVSAAERADREVGAERVDREQLRIRRQAVQREAAAEAGAGPGAVQAVDVQEGRAGLRSRLIARRIGDVTAFGW
jgi:hypothetical protein